MGDIEYRSGNYLKAKEYCLEGLALVRTLGIRLLITCTIIPLGYIAFELDEIDESYEYFLEAIRTGMEIQVNYLVLEALPGIAKHQVRKGDLVKAVELVSFTINHEECNLETREGGLDTLRLIENLIPSDIFRKAQETGSKKELHDVIQNIFLN
jgi:hypothetical protein